jgi:hypothetical protein
MQSATSVGIINDWVCPYWATTISCLILKCHSLSLASFLLS